MRLRSYIALISTLVVLGVLLLIYAQTQSILKTVLEHLDDIHSAAILSTSQGVVRAYAYRLKTYRTLFENDNQLSSSFLIARHQNAFKRFNQELAGLKKQIGCDLIEVVYSNRDFQGSTKIHSNGQGETELISESPLKNFGEVVGLLRMGFLMNGTIAREIEQTSGSKVHFFATASASTAQPHLNAVVRNLELALNDNSKNKTQTLSIEMDRQYIVNLKEISRREMAQVAIGSLILLLIVLYALLEVGFVRRFKRLLSSIHNMSLDLDRGIISIAPVARQPIREVDDLAISFSKFSQSLRTFQHKVQEKSRQAAFYELAEQVAHDLKSPLSALEMSLSMNQPPDVQSSRIRLCLDRIREMIHSLSQPKPIAFNCSIVLWPLIDQIVSEKKTQYATKRQISIYAWADPSLISFEVRLSAEDLRRVLSNLIDNSIQAITGEGSVKISLFPDSNGCELIISDNGCGIPDDVIPRLGLRGATFNKPTGSGLGLYSAQQLVESIGGRIEIDSKAGFGTSVTLFLPAVSS